MQRPPRGDWACVVNGILVMSSEIKRRAGVGAFRLTAFIRDAPMARISNAELERMKAETRWNDWPRRGVAEEARENLIGLCPFHEDHEPSLRSRLEPLALPGSVPDGGKGSTAMKAEGVSYRHALSRRGGTSFAAFPETPRAAAGRWRRRRRRRSSTVLSEARRTMCLRQVVDYYHER